MSNPPSYNDIFEKQVQETNEKNMIIDEIYELKNEIKDNKVQALLYKTKFEILQDDYLYFKKFKPNCEITAIIILSLLLWAFYVHKKTYYT
jgi:hypothetical protein